MFKDFIESILIFLDGREKIVAQIVIYVFLLSGGGYFLFVYEGEKETVLGNTIVSSDSGAIQNQENVVVSSSSPDTNSSTVIINETGEISPLKSDTSSLNTNITNQSNTGIKSPSNQTQTSISPDKNISQSTSTSQNVTNTIAPSSEVVVTLPEKEKEQVIIAPTILPTKEEIIPQDTIIPQDQITQNTTASQITTTQQQIQQNTKNTPVSNTNTTTTQSTGNINLGTINTPTENTGIPTSGGTTSGENTTNGTESNTESTGTVNGGTTTTTNNETSTPPVNTEIGTGENATSSGTTSTGDSGTDLVGNQEQAIEDYFDNQVSFNTGGNGIKQVKVVVQTALSPSYPIPNSCPIGYNTMGVYSNISSLTSLFVPYSDQYSNVMSIINEYEILSSGMKKYYKIFIVNEVKNGAAMYKTVSPNNDYHRVFTICIEQ